VIANMGLIALFIGLPVTPAIPGAAANPVIADKMYSAFVNFYKNYRVNLNLS
jgi:hypothetical protein